jgi:PAS domain S-box-containing protein
MPQSDSLPTLMAQNIFETVREPILVLDSALRVHRANRSFYQTFQLAPEETEGLPIYELENGLWNIPPMMSLLEEVMSGNSSFDDFEVEHDFKGVGRKIMLLNARRLHQPDGPGNWIVLAMEDVTERRRLEAERQELDCRFTSLVKNIRDHSIFTLTPEGIITSWNHEAEQILGYSEAEVLGEHFSIVFTKDDRQAGVPEQELSQAIVEGRAEDERWHLRKGGERFWALGIVTPTRDTHGNHTGFSKILRDMTDRKQAEENERQAHTLLEALLANAPIGIAYLDRDLRFVTVNACLARMNGLAAEAHVGKHVREVVPSLAAEAEKVASEVLSTGQAIHGVIFSGESPAAPGQMRCWNESWYPIRSAEEEIIGLGVVVEDITAHWHAEAALRESEFFYRQMLESVPGMTFTTRPDGYCDYQSQQWVEFTGVPMREHIGDGWLNLLHPDDKPRAAADWQTAVEGRGEYNLEYRIRRADGVYEWFKVRARAIRDAEGNVVRWFGTAVNIDALKCAEEELRQGEERQSFLLKLSDALRPLSTPEEIKVTAMGLVGEFFKADRATYFEIEDDQWVTNPCGYSADGNFMPPRLLLSDFGQPWLDAYAQSHTLSISDVNTDPRFSEQDRIAWQALGMSGGVGVPLNKKGQLKALVGLNTRRPHRWTNQELLLIEEVAHRTWSAVERAHAEAGREAARTELAAQSRFLEAITASIPDCVYAFDRDKRFVYANKATRALFGLHMQILGKNFDDLHYPPEMVTKLNQQLDEVLSTGNTIQDEVYYSTPTGTKAYYHYVWGPVLDKDGAVAMVAGVSRDTTERHRLEEQLRDADLRKTEFLAMLGHELRNPLAPIRNAVTFLQLQGPKDAALEEARDVIVRQVDHLSRLVDDLLDVSRVSCGKVQVHKQPIDLRDAVRQAVETSRPLIDARRHTLQVDLPEMRFEVLGDLTRLIQVTSNLLNNAAKYTDDGGQICVRLERENAQAVIRVRDNGRGIEPANLSQLFGVFYQSNRNLDRSEGGLGLGLALVKSLVELHGGSVDARSLGSGKGSEFVVRLPLLNDVQLEKELPLPEVPVETRGALKILVVDDNRDSAMTMGMLLKIAGHRILTTYDGLAAVDLAVAERPDVVLLDIGLPKLDGFQACRAMRSAGLSQTKIIAITGYGQEDDRRKTLEAGFDFHLIKPVDTAALLKLLTNDSLSNQQSTLH